MSLACYVGPEHNLLEITDQHCSRLLIKHPILTNAEMLGLKRMSYRDWKSQEIDITCPVSIGEEGLLTELKRICGEAEDAVDQGFQFLILSDRLVGPTRVAPSMLLASSAVHQHLVRTAKRTRVCLLYTSPSPRDGLLSRMPSSA